MKVRNDFPNVDSVLRKLKEYNSYFRQMQKTSNDEDDLFFAEQALGNVATFIESIEKYLDSACNMESRIQKVKQSTRDTTTIQEFVDDEEDRRTLRHSQVIQNMTLIDKFADLYGLSRVFDYAEEFQQDCSELTPSREGKKYMSERARIKRREMGNFGLYIAAAVTAGVSREAAEITDDDLREFADCEGDTVKVDTGIFNKVKENSKALKRNVDIMIDDDNLPGGLT